MVSVVIGLQWGDEGKGKIVDLLSQKSQVVVRFHGGNNAGHTVKNSFGTFPLHLIPSGIFNKRAQACISNGVVLDLDVLLSEIKTVSKVLPDLKKRLFISPRCHIIMPYHKLLDGLYEQAKGKKKVGTTGRGIGPVHADKVSYHGIRLLDVKNQTLFAEKLQIQVTLKNRIIRALGGKPLIFTDVLKQIISQYQELKPYVKEPLFVIQDALQKKKAILGEGAQGFFLDNDWGTYPFVTASNIVAGNLNSSAGVAPTHIKKIIGVSKAYTTRVGSGPFPTELIDAFGEHIRKIGQEFGTTTGRPRRCGWLDLELLRFACLVSGTTDIALTKLDVLDDMAEIIICVGYTLQGKKIRYEDVSAEDLVRVKPVFKTLKGWQRSTRTTRSFRSLPTNARNYVRFIEEFLGVPITIVSIGQARSETIIRT